MWRLKSAGKKGSVKKARENMQRLESAGNFVTFAKGGKIYGLCKTRGHAERLESVGKE